MSSSQDDSKDSIGELLDYLAPGLAAGEACPAWPPDVFALAGAVLERSGAFFGLVALSFDRSEALLEADWPNTVRSIAKRWRAALNDALASARTDPDAAVRAAAVPGELHDWWRVLRAGRPRKISGAHADAELCRAAYALVAIADQASRGMGIRYDEKLLEYARFPVLTRQQWLSLCVDVSREKIRVLPKQHTSQRGITLRSLSHNLALHFTVSVDAEWFMPPRPATSSRLDLLNLLLLPWPTIMERNRFRVADARDGAPPLPDRYRFFRLGASTETVSEFRRRLEAAVVEAKSHVNQLHGVVFPELSLSHAQYLVAEDIAHREKLLLIAGVWLERDEQLRDCRGPTNVCVVQPAGLATSGVELETLRLVRAKNHRWCLDDRQIRGYGLEGRLPASKDCWELTALRPRAMTFLTLDRWMTLCVQICEDLARQDDVASLIRAVGPNLVVALLMDGPQLTKRWPARYASILADDPGSSVLTLTSLGMSRLGKPEPGQPDRSRVIALWRDIVRGEREIELGEGEDACLVHLVSYSTEEFSADGRGDGGVAHFPVLSGYRGLTTTR